MKYFYHADADGKCAGYLVETYAKNTDKYPITMHEINYHIPFPIDSIMDDEEVYIVDFSISPDEMRKLLDITKNVTWVDHHKTAIEKYDDFTYRGKRYGIRGIRTDGIAGCMLTWCYLTQMTDGGLGDIRPMLNEAIYNAPYFIKLIADWDVWKFEYGDDTRNFHTAFEAYDFNPRSKEWARFLIRTDGGLIEDGVSMTIFRDQWAKNYCKALGFATMFEGRLAFAMNLGLCNSEYFKSIDNGKYEILMPFSFNGSEWIVSMYSKTVDVSKIAKIYGGGGHKGAAGFHCATLPFENIKKEILLW